MDGKCCVQRFPVFTSRSIQDKALIYVRHVSFVGSRREQSCLGPVR
jgi:hypothetical protein